ncbi:Protein trapped in endoderm-1 [Eumeta japonica]|uniref:Protein trapped in endoderm-1 n=1 Tax=Eumeta variegata TaxID=151549 RepID=A0A4C1U139_EUMVA|nr:Protein trapped in endoderm-1 [Eumeta japonica]
MGFFNKILRYGNSVTCAALLTHPRLRGHATTLFVISLCASDLLFSAISLPLTAVRFATQRWTLGSTLCQMFAFLFYGNEAVSLLSMVAITINSIKRRCVRVYNEMSHEPLPPRPSTPVPRAPHAVQLAYVDFYMRLHIEQSMTNAHTSSRF